MLSYFANEADAGNIVAKEQQFTNYIPDVSFTISNATEQNTGKKPQDIAEMSNLATEHNNTTAVWPTGKRSNSSVSQAQTCLD